jgi:hypothetical protein
MSSHTAVLNTLLGIRTKLEKSLTAEESLENQESSILDMLKVVQETHVTPETISQSGLGKVISSIRKKYSTVSTAIGCLSSSIMLNWKKIVKNGKEEKPAQSGEKKVIADSVRLEQLRLLKQENFDRLSSISKPRMVAFNIFRNLFKEIEDIRAETLALDIEDGLNNMLSHDSMSKAYMAKARSLAFNISKNNVLFSCKFPLSFSFFLV